ncbi:MAG: lactonase family protein [Lachnospiraceae bacterium]|nr:lactonase family protein [Lachnospiraceae bacterium]
MTKVIVGNWCPGPGEKGFSLYDYESATGSLTFLSHSYGEIAASFLGNDLAGKHIYATNESDACADGVFSNEVVKLQVSASGTEIQVADRISSLGPNPPWICGDGKGEYLLIPHHGGFGHTSTITRKSDGSLSERLVQDESHIILMRLKKDGSFDCATDAYLPKKRNKTYKGQMSRTHCIRRAPGKNLFFACDKGFDCVISLAINYEEETIFPLDQIAVSSQESPRYGVCHPRLPIFYADMEGSANVYAFSYDDKGKLFRRQKLNVLPRPLSESVMPSDIVMDEEGAHLYVAIRKENVIAVIGLDKDGGMSLQTVAENPDGAPNILRFSPDRQFMFVTNVFEKVISKFLIRADGSLQYMGIAARDVCPASMVFVEM